MVILDKKNTIEKRVVFWGLVHVLSILQDNYQSMRQNYVQTIGLGAVVLDLLGPSVQFVLQIVMTIPMQFIDLP